MRPRRRPQPQMTLSAALRELPANAECDSTYCLHAPGCAVPLLPAGLGRAAPGPFNFRYILLLARDGVVPGSLCPNGDGGRRRRRRPIEEFAEWRPLAAGRVGLSELA